MNKTLIHQILRGLWVIIIIALIWIAVVFTAPLIYPFIIGWIIAYILNPLVGYLERRLNLPRWLAVTISILLFLAIITLFITLIIVRIINEITRLTLLINENINGWIEHIVNYSNSEYINNIASKINIFYNENENYQKTINDNLSSAGKRIAETITGTFGHIVDILISILSALPTLAAVIIVALLAAFFIGKDWHAIIRRLSSYMPGSFKAPSRMVWADLQKALFGYIMAQLVLISITAIFVFIGLLLFRVNYAFSISLLIGFVDLLPYLGTGTVMVPWAIITFISGNIPLGIGLSILYGIILIVRQLIEPKILSKSIGLKALPTLIAMFAGLKLFGVLGLIIGPILLIVLSAIYRANVFKDIYGYVMVGKNSIG